VQAEWTARHSEALAKIYDVLEGPLGELLALRLAINSLV
jgi:hypothetical protein